MAVRELFDGMAGAYDDLHDLWYGYLFERMHQILEHRYRGRTRNLGVLDVGCGTGQQALPFAEWGARVVALDLAAEPLRIARRKATALEVPLSTIQASATELPIAAERFDLVVSCGSVISFVPDYDAALSEMRRVLKPGGELAIEFEHRGSMDLLWPLVDRAIGGRLRYGQSAAVVLHNLFARWDEPVLIDYPFTRPDGVEVIFRLWLFGASAVERVLSRHGFELVERHSIHSVTNLIPSTLLNDPSPAPPIRAAFQVLSQIEDRVRRFPPFKWLGNSLFVVARKR